MFEAAGWLSGTIGPAWAESGTASAVAIKTATKTPAFNMILLVSLSWLWRQRLGQSAASIGFGYPPMRAHSQKAITIVLPSSRTRLMRFGLWTIPATPCVGTIVRKPRGRSSSRTTLAVPADALPFSANFLPMHCLQRSEERRVGKEG